MKNIKMKALILALAAAMFIPAFSGMARADEYKTDKEWKVTFTSKKKMVSNFKTKNIDDMLSKLQPGDSARFEINLKNENSAETDWYMSNKVLKSLEDKSKNKGTAGGAYSYKLVYTNASKKNNTLYDSERVGGEEKEVSPAGEGLHEATTQLEEYFFLESLKKGQSGKITLEVGLDSETQGNDYQDTIADLEMKFAVELPETGSNKKREIKKINRTVREMRNAVKTGDERNMLPYYMLGLFSGLILLLVGFYSLSLRKKERGETAAAGAGREE